MVYEPVFLSALRNSNGTLQLNELAPKTNNISVSFAYGGDGSGEHRNYEQKSKATYSTANVFTALLCHNISQGQ